MANMKLLLLALLALTVASSAMSARQVSYSCNGSGLCKYVPQGDCDDARLLIQPNNTYFEGSTGACFGNCGLFVSGGSKCNLTGQEMIAAFDELRAHDCEKCGIKTYKDKCKFKADFVPQCDY